MYVYIHTIILKKLFIIRIRIDVIIIYWSIAIRNKITYSYMNNNS